MAALLRHGARRVGGSVVQRTQAAFTTPAAAGERRLLTTEVQRTQAASTTPAAGGERRLPTEHARPRHKDPQAVSCEIEVMKEDLYDLLSVMEVSNLPMKYQNRQLLKFLPAQVKPRPDEFQWREMRSSRKTYDYIETTIFVSTCMLGFEVWYSMAGGKEAQTAKKKQR